MRWFENAEMGALRPLIGSNGALTLTTSILHLG